MVPFRPSGDYVSCPLCEWKCLHHGSRSDGLPVSWRNPPDQSSSESVHDRAFVRQFAVMRKHARGHEVAAGASVDDVARARLALSFIPSRHRVNRGDANELREAERKKRVRLNNAEQCRLRRKRLRLEKEEEKISQVCGSAREVRACVHQQNCPSSPASDLLSCGFILPAQLSLQTPP